MDFQTDTQVPGVLAGGGGRIRADNFSDKSGNGAPNFPKGIVVSGIITATLLNQNISGIVSATAFHGDGSALTNINIPAGFTELDAALFN